MASALEALRNKLYTVAIVCALPLETAACTLILDVRHGPPRTLSLKDTNSYQLGKIGDHNVVITWLPQGVYGTNSAATTITNLLSSFPYIEFGLFVGIGGGIPSKTHDIRLGDVVVGKPEGTSSGVVQWDLGKAENGGIFRRSGCLNKPPAVLLKATAGLEARGQSKIPEYIAEIYSSDLSIEEKFPYPGQDNDNLYKSNYVHQGDSATCEPCCRSNLVSRNPRKDANPVVHYGTIASGNQVIKDALVRDRIGNDLGAICIEMEAAGVVDVLPMIVIRGICDYSDSHKNKSWQPYAGLTASAYAKDLLCGILPITARDSYQKFIDRLPRAKGASFDSIYTENEPKCLPDTRTDLLKGIKDWIINPDGKKTYWLHGQAGTGKSTIARTIAHDYSHILGANFFFKRGESDRGYITKLCSTLATDLVQHLPLLRGPVSNSIENDPNISEKGLREQFEKLIKGPLAQLKVEAPQTILIVIDALDECECEEGHMPLLIQQLASIESPKPLSIRVFLTSRPETVVTSSFRKLNNGTFEDLDLRDIDSLTIEHDISVFLNSELTRIQQSHPSQDEDEEDRLPIGWPGNEKLNILVKMTSPWFIAAATIAKFLAEPRMDPQVSLEIVLASPAQSLSGLGRIYKQVINQILMHDEKVYLNGDIIADFKSIVGTILLLEFPLSRSSLSKLLNIKGRQISNTLRGLNSILSIPLGDSEPIEMLHLSLRDFLTNEREAGEFWVDGRKTHRNISRKCIKLLSEVLHEDMCELQRPGTWVRQIDPGVKKTYIPPATEYACRYWIHHLILAGDDIIDNGIFHTFLTKYLLYWLEVISIVGYFHETIKSIVDLERITQEGSDVAKFLYDSRLFMLEYKETIMEWPLQLYSSCMLFAPEMNLVRKSFSDTYPAWVRRISKMEPCWENAIRIRHSADTWNRIIRMVFSPDGRTLALGLHFPSILLRDVITGAPSKTSRLSLNGPITSSNFYSERQYTMVFLSEGKQLASVDRNGSFGLWDVATGTLDQLTSLYTDEEANGMQLSPDGRFLATTTNKWLKLREVTTGKQIWNLERSGSSDDSIVFSSDGGTLAISNRRDLSVLDTITGTLLWNFEGKTDYYFESIALSPDGEYLAAGHDISTRLYDMIYFRGPDDGSEFEFELWMIAIRKETHEPKVERLPNNPGNIGSLAFSPDGKILAIGTTGGKIMWLDIATKIIVSMFETALADLTYRSYGRDRDYISQILFSPDGESLAVVLQRTTIILRTKSVIRGTQRGFDISNPVLSKDGKRLAAILQPSDVGLWDATNGQLIKKFEGPEIKSPLHHTKTAFSVIGQRNLPMRNDSVDVWDNRRFEDIRSDGMRKRRLKVVKNQDDSRPLPVPIFLGLREIVFSPDGVVLGLIYEYDVESELVLWNVVSESIDLKRPYPGLLKNLAFYSDKILMVVNTNPRSWVTSSPDLNRKCSIQKLDIITGAILREIKMEPYSHLDTLALSPDGKLILSVRGGTGEVALYGFKEAHQELDVLVRLEFPGRHPGYGKIKEWATMITSSFMQYTFLEEQNTHVLLSFQSWYGQALKQFQRRYSIMGEAWDGSWIQWGEQKIMKIPKLVGHNTGLIHWHQKYHKVEANMPCNTAPSFDQYRGNIFASQLGSQSRDMIALFQVNFHDQQNESRTSD